MEKKTFTAEEDLEEAIRMARYESFLVGPEMAAGKRVTQLREKQRTADQGGPPLSRAEEVNLRFLGLLYPPPRRTLNDEDRILKRHPFLDLPAEVEATLETAKGPLFADLEDFECPSTHHGSTPELSRMLHFVGLRHRIGYAAILLLP